jgi:hypothetical protein
MALDKLIANLTLNLNDKEVERLEAPIKESEMRTPLKASPQARTNSRMNATRVAPTKLPEY